MADNEALQESEQDSLLMGDDDFAITGSQGAPLPSGGPQPSPTPQNAPSGQLPGGGVPSTNDDDQQMPQASGRALFLGNLLRTVLSGGLAGAAQANPAMARGYAAQQQAVQQQRQQQQQAQQQSAQAVKDMDAHQMNVVKFQTAQMQQAIMAHQMIHLDDAHNQGIVNSLEKSTEFDRKEGLMQDEQEVDGEGMQAYQSAVKLAGQLNAKAGISSEDRYKVGITDGSDLKHLKFNVYKANMNGKVTRDVFTGKGEDGSPQYESMTGKYTDLDALEQGNRTRATQDATKETLKDLHKTLGNQKPPETQDEADFRLSQLNTVLQMHPDPVAKQLAQNEVMNIKKNYAALPKTQQAAKERQAAAGSARRDESKEKGNMYYAEIKGEQVAGSAAELKAAGATDDDLVKLGAAETEKVVNARILDKQFNKAESLIEDLNNRGELGVFASRFNKLAAQKVGAGDPEYARLLAQIGLNETALLQIHVGAKGGSQLLEHFQELAIAGKMNYQTLKAAVQQEHDYVRDKAMRPGAKQAAQPTGSVPVGARPITKAGRTIGYIGADGKRVDFQ